MRVSTRRLLTFSSEIWYLLREQGERAKWTNPCKAGGPISLDTSGHLPSSPARSSPSKFAGQRAAQARHQPGEELLHPLAAAPQHRRKGHIPRGSWERHSAKGLALPKREGPWSPAPLHTTGRPLTEVVGVLGNQGPSRQPKNLKGGLGSVLGCWCHFGSHLSGVFP